MSFCAGPRMRRSLGSEVSRREAPKLIQGICVLTEVLENCCKMECKGEEKNDGNCFSLPFIITWLWLKSQESLLTILGPLGVGVGGWMRPHCLDYTCDQWWQNSVSEGLAHLHPIRSQESVSCIHMDTCWMLHLNFLYMKILLSLVICMGDWLHTAPFKLEGLGYNSFYDKKEYLFILALAAARKYFKHICSEWSHCMAQSYWYVKFPE